MSRLQALAESLDLQHEIVESFASLERTNPDAARALVKSLVEQLGLNGTSRASGKRGSDMFAKVAAMFIANGNTPLTKREMEKNAGISSSAVHTLLYTTATGKFKSEPNPKGGRAVVIRLADSAYAEAQKGVG